jgi:hypothetical protein
VTGRIREDQQCPVWVVGPVKHDYCAKGYGSLALPMQFSATRNREVNVQLHRDVVRGPC